MKPERQQGGSQPTENDLARPNGKAKRGKRRTTLKELERAAREFRAALLRCNARDLPIGLSAFPLGACGDASLLLGEHFRRLGYGAFTYVCGKRGQQTHAWIERSGVVIDITADQFPEVNTPVLVTKAPAWHRQFPVDFTNTTDLRKYDPQTRYTLERALTAIEAQLRTDQAEGG